MTTPNKPPASGTDWLRQHAGIANKAHPAAPACPPEKAQSSQIEAWLQKHGVRYGPLTQIPIGMIDVKASRHNQARAEAIVQDSVDRFALSLRRGETLPPVVCFKDGNKLVLIDGNNRDEAHRKVKSQFIPGYIVADDTPSETILLMTVDANAHHGVTPDLKWRLKQAVNLVANGHSQDRAAEAAGVTKAQLGDYQALIRADARAKQFRIQAFTDLAPTTRFRLGRLQLDAVFHNASRMVIDTAMTVDEVSDLIRDIKAERDEASQLALVARIGERRKLEAQQRKALGKTSNSVSSPKTSLVSAIGKIVKIDPVNLARQVLTEMDRKLLLAKVNEAVEALGEIEAQITRGREERDAS